MPVLKNKNKPAAAAAPKNAGSQDMSPEAFFKELQNKQQVIKDASTKQAPTGGSFIDQYELPLLLDMEDGGTVMVPAQVHSIRFRKGYNGAPEVNFNYLITEGPANGRITANAIELFESDQRTYEEQVESVMFELQRLGFETKEIKTKGVSALKGIFEKVVQIKPACMLRIYAKEAGGGKHAGELRAYVGAQRVLESAPQKDEVANTDSDESGDNTEVSEEEGVTLAQLGEMADNGDQEAADLLTEEAEKAGLDPNDSDTYPDWATLAEALEGA